LWGGGILFSGCDQIQEILGLGDGEEKPAPSDDGPDVPQGTPDEPEAFIGTGGEGTFVLKDNQWYEVHTFRVEDDPLDGNQAIYMFSFETEPPEAVEVLVVGGGGGGGNTDTYHDAGGGGAGGYVYVPAYPVGKDSITVKVGAGGVKPAHANTHQGTSATCGGNGGDSEFGGITATGGGGGANHAYLSYNSGAAGGSGGGGSSGSGGGSATPGTVSPDNLDPAPVIYGNSGAAATKPGAGGGGGGGAGSAASGAIGGIGISFGISGTEEWYAGGGMGGGGSVPEEGPPPDAYGATVGTDGMAGTGDGGSGGHNAFGGNGGSGIVIVRFPR
jgi:hypothetical protein